MFSIFSKWILSIFSADKLGIIFRLLFMSAGKTVLKDMLDTENQKKAYEFVKELNARTDMTNTEKAWEFNKKMYAWAKKEGKNIAESIINCLREMAVNALKAEAAAEEK